MHKLTDFLEPTRKYACYVAIILKDTMHVRSLAFQAVILGFEVHFCIAA
jgi:hypothetical protein